LADYFIEKVAKIAKNEVLAKIVNFWGSKRSFV
jgi:hypothetical protein